MRSRQLLQLHALPPSASKKTLHSRTSFPQLSPYTWSELHVEGLPAHKSTQEKQDFSFEHMFAVHSCTNVAHLFIKMRNYKPPNRESLANSKSIKQFNMCVASRITFINNKKVTKKKRRVYPKKFQKRKTLKIFLFSFPDIFLKVIEKFFNSVRP